jgi:hypothetical protein
MPMGSARRSIVITNTSIERTPSILRNLVEQVFAMREVIDFLSQCGKHTRHFD